MSPWLLTAFEIDLELQFCRFPRVGSMQATGWEGQKRFGTITGVREEGTTTPWSQSSGSLC